MDPFSFHSKFELRKIEAVMCIIAKLAFNSVTLGMKELKLKTCLANKSAKKAI